MNHPPVNGLEATSTADSPSFARQPEENVVMATSAGGLIAAFLGSICCIGPLVLAALGVGVGTTGVLAGTAGFLKGLLPYRPAFISLTILLLGFSFYLVYGRPKTTICTPGDVCAPGTRDGANAAWLWIMAAFALVLILAPYWLGL